MMCETTRLLMSLAEIDQDHSRFRAIVRGKIRQNLRKYISQGELIGRKGKDLVSIPIPQIDIPRFRFGDQQQRARVRAKTAIRAIRSAASRAKSGARASRPGRAPASTSLEVDVTLDELAAILGEELELPDIQDKGKSSIINAKDRYTGVRRVGPESLRHFRRTYQRGAQAPDLDGHLHTRRARHRPDPGRQALPHLEDRSRAGRQRRHHLHDGRVGLDGRRAEGDRPHRELLDRYAGSRSQYKGLESRYIIHDAVAREVDRDDLLPHPRVGRHDDLERLQAVLAAHRRTHYPPEEWNIYPFHFSDGDNWSMDDTLAVHRDPQDSSSCRSVNMFAYGQVESPYGSGQFIKDLREHFDNDERVVTERDSRPGRHRRAASKTSWARGK